VFVCQSNISETAKGFAPNSKRRRIWSLARTSFNVKVKGQGHQGQKRSLHSHHHPAATEWNAAADETVPSLPGGDFGCLRAVLCLVKRSLALVFCFFLRLIFWYVCVLAACQLFRALSYTGQLHRRIAIVTFAIA